MNTERTNHTIAWYYFKAIGKIPRDAGKQEWCLHHVDTTLKYTDPERYNEWRIEDLVPMTMADHTALHWQDPAAKLARSEKISEAKRGKPGHLHSDETRAKISAALKGHEVPEETRAKISAGCMGRPSWLKGTHGLVTPWNKGKRNCYSEETLRRMGEGNRGRAQSLEERSKRAKSVAEAWKDKKLLEKQAKRVSNSIWINNGDASRRISKDAEIPEGWSKGRLGGWNRKTNKRK